MNHLAIDQTRNSRDARRVMLAMVTVGLGDTLVAGALVEAVR